MDLRSLIDQFDNAYTIPSPIVIAGKSAPTDIRQVCETVQDFEDFLNATRMDIRYPGLVTYEKKNDRFLGYKKDSEGQLVWVPIGTDASGSVVELENKIKDLEERMSSIQLEFEGQRNLLIE